MTNVTYDDAWAFGKICMKTLCNVLG